MIHDVYSDGLFESYNTSNLGQPPNFVDDYANIKYLLENTDHIFIFILTKNQTGRLKSYHDYGFEEYEIFRTARPITNHNYPADGRKLNIFILKGKGKIHDF